MVPPPVQWTAITLIQPMGSAIIEESANPKRIENRSTPIVRASDLPRWFGLHAGRAFDEGYADSIVHILGEDDTAWLRSCPQGAMLGAILIDWMEEIPGGSQFVKSERLTALHKDPWAFGPWCLHIADVRRLPTPVTCRGMLGTWPVEGAALEALRALFPE